MPNALYHAARNSHPSAHTRSTSFPKWLRVGLLFGAGVGLGAGIMGILGCRNNTSSPSLPSAQFSFGSQSEQTTSLVSTLLGTYTTSKAPFASSTPSEQSITRSISISPTSTLKNDPTTGPPAPSYQYTTKDIPSWCNETTDESLAFYNARQNQTSPIRTKTETLSFGVKCVNNPAPASCDQSAKTNNQGSNLQLTNGQLSNGQLNTLCKAVQESLPQDAIEFEAKLYGCVSVATEQSPELYMLARQYGDLASKHAKECPTEFATHSVEILKKIKDQRDIGMGRNFYISLGEALTNYSDFATKFKAKAPSVINPQFKDSTYEQIMLWAKKAVTTTETKDEACAVLKGLKTILENTSEMKAWEHFNEIDKNCPQSSTPSPIFKRLSTRKQN